MVSDPRPIQHVIGVSVPVPDPYGADLQRWRESFGDPLAGSIPSHITLLPPTPVYDDDLGRVREHLRGVAAGVAPFRVRLRGTGTFRPVTPVVFVAVAQGIAECERIEERIRRGPLERELVFPYHPHVTVAHDLGADLLDRAFKQLSGYQASFDAWGFALYEHGDDGVWRPRWDFPFAGS